MGVNANHAVAAGGFCIGGFVADGVLIANVVGDSLADLVDFVEGARKESDAAGLLRQNLQSATGVAFFFATQQPDGVDGGSALLLQGLRCLLQRIAAGIVFAVGDHEDDLLVAAGVAFQMIGGGVNGVVESRAAAGIIFFQGFLQLANVGGEVLIKKLFVIEVDDDDFVLRIARTNQIEASLIHLFALLPHRAGVVDDDGHGDGNVLMAEGSDGLLHAVFQNRKCGTVQVRNQVIFFVNYGRMERNFLHALVHDEHAFVFFYRLGGGGTVLWRDRARRNPAASSGPRPGRGWGGGGGRGSGGLPSSRDAENQSENKMRGGETVIPRQRNTQFSHKP